MFNKFPEQTMHRVRWFLTSAWLILVFSLFYDPISPWLTDSRHTWSPFRLDPNVCVKVQGVCLEEKSYAIGASVFWGMVVPASIFILLVFGHELWRRICPLSFLSQLPAALKWQRQLKRVDAKTGKTRFEIARVKKDSWLGRNHLYLQFGLLYLGLCSRILFINSDRLALGVWFLVTIGGAIAVGYLYGGKSWCQYFCPMAPVQKIYAEPAGLFTSKAHQEEQPITQSMCRIINEDGKEQSGCVACKSPCIDIDSERSYWDGINQPEQKWLYYGYVGLVIGYFLYYYLYAGNWHYYFSGAWAHQENQLATLLNPGFYLFNTPIPIPKLVAVPLTVGGFGAGGYWLGRFLEKRYTADLRRKQKPLSKEQIQHRMFTLCTFVVFNIFFIFGGRPFILLLPYPWQAAYEAVLVCLSTLWLYRTWKRSPDIYDREGLAYRLRKQLHKLKLDTSRFMEGRSLDDLTSDEVYALAKVLPGFTREKRREAYKGVLREALEEGYVNTSSSLEVLQQTRFELDISDEEHRTILGELGVEDPDLLNPGRQRDRENLVRLTGYRKALDRIVALQQLQSTRETGSEPGNPSILNLLQENRSAIKTLQRQYSVTFQEEEQIFEEFDQDAKTMRRAELLLSQLATLIDRYHALNQPILIQQGGILPLLRETLRERKQLLVQCLLEMMESLKDAPEGTQIARSLGNISPTVLQDLLEDPTLGWSTRLNPQLLSLLNQPEEFMPACRLDLEPAAIAQHLEALLFEPDPLIQAISLYLLYQLDADRGREQAKTLLASRQNLKELVQQTAAIILAQSVKPENLLTTFSSIEKLVYLSNSDFFNNLRSETLIQLAERAEIKVYQAGDVVTEEGDTCRELLLLIEGQAQIELHRSGQDAIVKHLVPNQMLDELEVLGHIEQTGTIVATTSPARILAIPVDTLDDLLEHDPNFARQILEMES
ncbi:MAG: cyclic nucleotide-binding domain-containing protein, partial [Leptolyngbyaceae bacterium]|nr:cyclic nucleotide-binding domain-containing protein [Leptolyngbyaceae bacterium]